ncbi:uncharacterized protein LOC117104428 [Anneissia japonica]|uniref:uncharacterized protein LOC117104428 n=1 Tax=Anneissia japonica TaxID=1529436 RepID=UPI0014258EA0|nr:uncharacterized protein LOC117104428 [Anneissia japonica]
MEFETTNTVVPALPVISKILQVDKEQRDSDALKFLNSLKQNSIDINEIEKALTKWHNTREKLINQLHEITDKIRKNKRNTHIARIIGASTSTAGAVMCITTGILSFVTLGVATTLFVVSVVGACAAAVGGGVAAGASFTAKVLSGRGSKEANTLIEEDNVRFQFLKDVQQRYIDNLKNYMKLTQKNDKVVLEFKKIGGVISIAIRVGNNISKTISIVNAVRTVVAIQQKNSVSLLIVVENVLI